MLNNRPEAWRAVVLRDEANGLLAAILTLSSIVEAALVTEAQL